MIRNVALACALVMLTSRAFAVYTPPRFFELIGAADLIVAGEIESLGNGTYSLRIERVLSGQCFAPSIEVVRFRDWACAQRWKPYAKADRLVAFLQHDEPKSTQLARPVYRAIGPGIESEFPREGDFVYCHLTGALAVTRADEQPYAGLYKVRLSDLVAAIEGYRSLYRCTLRQADDASPSKHTTSEYVARVERVEPPPAKSAAPFRPRPPTMTPLARLKEYAHRSPVHWSLVESTEEIAFELGAADIGWRTQRQRASTQGDNASAGDVSSQR